LWPQNHSKQPASLDGNLFNPGVRHAWRKIKRRTEQSPPVWHRKTQAYLAIVDKSNSLVYVVIANASSKAAQLVTLENPSVTSPKVGSIYTIVSGGGGYTDGVLASGGKVHGPFGIAVDANENLFIADGTNNLVRMVNGPGVTNSSGTTGICTANSCAPGFIHAIAGLYASCTSTSCTALAGVPTANASPLGTGFAAPMGIAVDSYGNLYIGDNSAGTTTIPSTVRVIYAGAHTTPWQT
jgi:hypothetical protein